MGVGQEIWEGGGGGKVVEGGRGEGRRRNLEKHVEENIGGARSE